MANDALDADKIVGDTTDDDDLDVAAGGTGVSTLADGGPLLGSGTGDITAMAVLANGEFIVGDGTTDPVAESGATLRTSIGVGTGDSPTFTGLSLTNNFKNTDLDLDTLMIDVSGVSATNTFAVGTRALVYMDANTELFGIDTTGAIVTGTWSGTSISDANVDDGITVTNYLLLTAILDSLNNYDGDISFTQGNTTLKVLLDSLNNYDGDVLFTQGNTALAANVVALNEMADNAIRDAEINSAQVTKDSIFALSSNGFLERTAANTYTTTASLSDGDIDDGITVTNYLLLAAILDSLNNYDGDISFTQGNTTLKVLLDTLDNYNGNILFTQGNTALNTNAVDNINELSVALWNTATFVTYDADTMLVRDPTDGALKKTIITTSGMNASAFNDSINNYDGDVIFTQGNSTLKVLLDTLNNYDGDITFTQGNTTLKVLLDTLNNYDGDITFTQGNTTLKVLLDTLDNYNGDITFTQGNTTLSGFVLSKSWFIESPVAGDSLVGTVRWPYAVTIDSVITLVEYAGTVASPPADTVTFNMRHGTSFRLLGPDGTGTLLFSANQTIKDNTTGDVFSSFNDNTITAGSFISPYIVTQGGTVASATILLYWTKDP